MGGLNKGVVPGAGTPRMDDRSKTYSSSTDYIVVNNVAADQVYLIEENAAERRTWSGRSQHAGRRRSSPIPTTSRTPARSPSAPAFRAAPTAVRVWAGGWLGGDANVIASPGWSFNPDSTRNDPVPGVHGHSVPANTMVGRPVTRACRPHSVAGADLWPIRTAGRRCRRTEGLASRRSPDDRRAYGARRNSGLYDGKQLTEASSRCARWLRGLLRGNRASPLQGSGGGGGGGELPGGGTGSGTGLRRRKAMR